MANANRPSGLAPVGYLGAADWDGRGNVYYIPSGDGSAFYIGDPVTLAGSSDANGIPSVSIGIAGATCLGAIIALGVNPGGPWIDPTNLDAFNIPATKTKAYYVLVADDPLTIFEIQEIGTGTPLTATEVGLNANFVAAAPATGVRFSGYQLDNTTEAVTATLNLKILRLAPRPDNAIGQYAKWHCLINNHVARTGNLGL